MPVDKIKRSFISLVALLCLLITSHFTWASPSQSQNAFVQDIQTPVIPFYPNKTSKYFINSEMLYIEDLEHTESIDTILNSEHTWKEIYRNSPNFGFTATAYWFKFNINNISDKDQSIYLELFGLGL